MEEDTFVLGDEVKMKMSDEKGVVQGVVHYLYAPTSYYVMYKAADGRQASRWWEAQALEKVEKPE